MPTPRTAARLSACLLLGAGLVAPALAVPEKSARYYESALQRYEKNELSAAAVELANALKEDNKNLAAHLLLGRVLLRAGELKRAEAALEEALRLGVSKTEVAPALAQVYLQLGEYRRLLDTITLNGMPQSLHAELLTARGTALAMSGSPSEATQAFADARAADPRSALPLVAEAPLLLRAGERERARAMALKATELAPGQAMAWYQYGVILQALGEAQPALAAYDKALAINAKHVDSHVSRAAVLLALQRDAEAAAELKLLKDEKLVEPRASYLRGVMAQERGDVAAAKAEFTDAAHLIDAISAPVRAGNEPLLLVGALSHRALGNSQKTIEYLDTLLSRNARNTAAQQLMASVLLEANELSRAAPMIDALLRSHPGDPQALYLSGSLYLARKQYAQAAEQLERAAQAGTNASVLRDLSFSQFGLGANGAGVANLEKAFKLNPRDTRAGIELAVVYARTGQPQKALATAEAVVALEPQNPALLNFQANLHGRLGDRKSQRSVYERVLAKDAAFRPVVINLSWLDMDEGRFDDARKRLKAYLQANAKDPDALYQLGVLEQRARRPAEALALWAEAEKLPTKDARPGLATLELQLSQRQNEDALATTRRLTARFPDLLPVQIAAARAYLQAGDRNAARQTLQSAGVKAGFDAEALVTIARLQLQAGNPDAAAHLGTKALQSNPNDVAALVVMVEAAARRGQAAEVDKAMAALRARHPNHPLTHVTAGHIALSRRQPARAIESYRLAFDRAPATPLAINLTQAYILNNEAPKALALLQDWSARQPRDTVAARSLAEVQILLGKTAEARRTYENVLAQDPGDASLLAAYADVLQRQNDRGALAAAQKAYQIAPDNPQFIATYGRMQVLYGDPETGVRVLREARLREPSNGSLRWHLASALAKTGRKNEARDELRAALASDTPPAPGPELDRLRAEVGL